MRYVLAVILIAGLLSACQLGEKSEADKLHELKVACLAGGRAWDASSRTCAPASTVQPRVAGSWQTTLTPTATAAPMATPAPTATPTPTATATPEPLVYIVQSCDTLSAIALKSNVTALQLATFNGFCTSNLIYPGQVLAIPSTRYEPPAINCPTPASIQTIGSIDMDKRTCTSQRDLDIWLQKMATFLDLRNEWKERMLGKDVAKDAAYLLSVNEWGMSNEGPAGYGIRISSYGNSGSMPTIPELEKTRSLIGDVSAAMHGRFASDRHFLQRLMARQRVDVQEWAKGFWDWYNQESRLWNNLSNSFKNDVHLVVVC